MFHNKSPPPHPIIACLCGSGCSLGGLELVCVFVTGTHVIVSGRLWRIFFSVDSVWFVFNKGQKSALLWGRGKSHVGWPGQRVPGDRSRGLQC